MIAITKQGAGKGTEHALIAKLIGSKYCLESSDPSEVLGQFTSQLSGKLWITINEVTPKQLFDSTGRLKALVTDPLQKIERKGIDPYQEHSFVRVNINTNSENLIKLENGERRNCAYKPGVLRDSEDIYELLENEIMLDAVYQHLKKLEIPYKNLRDWQRARPSTDLHEEMKANSVDTDIKFICDYITTNEEVLKRIECPGFYDAYKAYCELCKKECLGYSALMRKIYKYDGIKTAGRVSVKTGKKEVKVSCFSIDKDAFDKFLADEGITVFEYNDKPDEDDVNLFTGEKDSGSEVKPKKVGNLLSLLKPKSKEEQLEKRAERIEKSRASHKVNAS